MTPQTFPELSAALCATCHLFGERQWCLATSGNFSVRVAPERCLITQSGKDKSTLSPDDLMICDLAGRALVATLQSSAETALHTCLYRHDGEIGAVLHTHSVAATVVSRAVDAVVEIDGLEMQKALRGVSSHEQALSIPVLENTQDMPQLAGELERRLAAGDIPLPAFLVRGHGLYAWGRTLGEAQRHVEGLEFLLQCLWQERLATTQ